MTKQELYSFRTEVTAKISEICRFIGLGLIAVFYTIQTGSIGKEFGLFQTLVLYSVGVAGVVAITFDYLQYLCNYRVVEDAIDADAKLFDDKSRAYIFAQRFFHWKQIVTVSGACALILLVLLS